MIPQVNARPAVSSLAMLLALGFCPARAATPEPDARGTLDRMADTHAPGSALLRDRHWDSATVDRLARWVNGERTAASPAEVELLRDELERPLSLSGSGAVSLGSYQGGFLYYYLRAIAEGHRLANDLAVSTKEPWGSGADSPLSLVTGTSSGSINTFIAAMTSCEEPVLDPRDSLFWRTWYPVDAEGLTSSVRVSPAGLFSLAPIEAAVEVVRKEWLGKGWSDGARCAVDIGLSTTRMSARKVQLLEDVALALPKQTERLMFGLRRDPGGTPTLVPFTRHGDDVRKKLLDKLFRQLGDGGAPTIDDALKLLRASSAFSFAFPPQSLRLWDPSTNQAEEPARFTDGGVFDDRPVGLAIEMQRWRLGVGGEDTANTRYVVQDADVEAWPRPFKKDITPPVADSKTPLGADPLDPTPFLDAWLPFVGSFVSTAVEIEVLEALERERNLYTRLEILPRRVPVAGTFLLEFLAFLEPDFRAYDYFTGMVDAWQQLAETSLAFQVLEKAGRGPTIEHAPELECLKAYRVAYLENKSVAPGVCAAVGTDPKHLDPGLRANFEALARASYVTLAWDEAHPKKDIVEQGVFLRALDEGPAPYVYRKLKYRGAPANASTVDLGVRDLMQDMIERATFNQPEGGGRFAMGSVAKAAANYYVYRPPVVYLAAGLVSDRGVELLGGRRLPWNQHRPPPFELRLDGALRLMGIHLAPDDAQPGTGRTAAFTYMAAAHLTNEFQCQGHAAPMSDKTIWQSTLQFQLGLGWAAESLQTWNGPLLWRQGPEVVLGVAAFQRFYFDVVYNRYLDDCAHNNRCSHADPFLSDKIPAIVDANWGLRFSLGYRFYVD